MKNDFLKWAFADFPQKFGNNSGLAFIASSLFLFAVIAFTPWRDAWSIATKVLCLAFLALWWVSTYQNFKTHLNNRARKPANNHYPDVCEGCDPVCMKDGSPITRVDFWYAAVHDITRPEAGKRLRMLPKRDLDAVYSDFTLYQAHPKFDRFKHG